MALGFTKRRFYLSEANNMAYSTSRAFISGCLAHEDSPVSMDVIVDSGKITWDSLLIDVLLQSVTLDPSDATFDRIDIITLDSSGNIGKVTGTPALIPRTPSYDETLYIIIGRVLIIANALTISNSDISDQRIFTKEILTNKRVSINNVQIDPTVESSQPNVKVIGYTPIVEFITAVENYVLFSFIIPQDANIANDFIIKVHFSQDGTDVNAFDLKIDGKIYDDGQLLTIADTFNLTSSPIPAGVINQTNVVSLTIPAVLITSKTQIISCKFSRDGLIDTNPDNFLLLNMEVEYQ